MKNADIRQRKMEKLPGSISGVFPLHPSAAWTTVRTGGSVSEGSILDVREAVVEAGIRTLEASMLPGRRRRRNHRERAAPLSTVQVWAAACWQEVGGGFLWGTSDISKRAWFSLHRTRSWMMSVGGHRTFSKQGKPVWPGWCPGPGVQWGLGGWLRCTHWFSVFVTPDHCHYLIIAFSTGNNRHLTHAQLKFNVMNLRGFKLYS